MKVFLTGGSGLVGRHLALTLMQRKDQVVCVTRSLMRARAALPVGVAFIEADPAVPGPWQDAVAGCDAVVNLAGESVASGRWTENKKRRLRRSRLETTRNLAEAIGKSDGPSVLVSASATGYYGNSGARALDESCEPGHDFMARLAREWEGTGLLAETPRTRVVLIRIGIVLAQEGGALPRMMTPFKIGLGGPLGHGQQYFPWIHIEDLIRVVMFALDTPDLSGPVNAVAPDPPTQGAFARALGSIMKRPSFLPTPAFFLRALLGEKGDMILASQRVVPKVLRARGFHFKYDNLNDALADLIQPTE